MSSSHHISGSEEPTIVLNDFNYLEWEFQMRVRLEREGLWKYVTGESKRWTGPLDDWERQDNQALQRIISAIDSVAMLKIKGLCSAKDIWDALRQEYQRRQEVSVFNLRRQLCRIEQGKNESVKSFADRITLIASTLSSAGVQFDNEAKCLTLMKGLSDEYKVQSVLDKDAPSLGDSPLDFEKFVAILGEYERRFMPTRVRDGS